MRLLEIWLAVRWADLGDLDRIEGEVDALVDASVRAEVHRRAEGAEIHLVPLLVGHVREAVQRRRDIAQGGRGVANVEGRSASVDMAAVQAEH